MKITESRTNKFWIIAIIFLGVLCIFYYTTHKEITDAYTLISKTIKASEDVKSYRFNISTNLTIHGEDIQIISGRGCLDYKNKKLHVMMKMINNTIEMIVIDNTAYIRESNGLWQEQKLPERALWKSNYDFLSQQRSILLNSSNVTMRKEENGWILEVIPDKEVVIEQMKKMTNLKIKKKGLKKFIIRYWIEKDNYHIKSIENNVELEMNIKGIETTVKLNNFIYIYDYNEKMKIKSPVD